MVCLQKMRADEYLEKAVAPYRDFLLLCPVMNKRRVLGAPGSFR
jgi:hypothetical protein